VGDIYIHSELENSSVVIIKTPFEEYGGGVVPPGTLTQAGIMAVATSRAWDAKQGNRPLLFVCLLIV
jgi:predicted ribosome quality control (RQC) complex YloA/Tae2 family protein